MDAANHPGAKEPLKRFFEIFERARVAEPLKRFF